MRTACHAFCQVKTRDEGLRVLGKSAGETRAAAKIIPATKAAAAIVDPTPVMRRNTMPPVIAALVRELARLESISERELLARLRKAAA